jgi:uncharacterized membrane protein
MRNVLAVAVVVSAFHCQALGQDAGAEFFESRIRPVLAEHCYRCHSAEAAKAGKLKGGLQLDTRAGIRAGGETGPAVRASAH